MGVRVSDSLSLSPLFPLTLVSLPLPSCQLRQAAPMQTAVQAQKSSWSRAASFPAAFPGACHILEPLAPPAQCLCAHSFRKEGTCSRVGHKGYVLSPCCCGCVSALPNALQVTIPRLPPDLVVSKCMFSQALAIHNALLVPSWEFYRALTFPRGTAGLQGGTVVFCISCDRRGELGCPGPPVAQMCVCMCHCWKVGVHRDLHLASSCRLHPKCLLAP